MPKASFYAHPSWSGLLVYFKNNCSDGDAPFTYQWDFGDGSPKSTQQSPTHQYGAAGTYTVVLTVTDFDGHVSVSIQIITVNDWTWLVVVLVAVGVGIIAWIGYRKRKYGKERKYTSRSECEISPRQFERDSTPITVTTAGERSSAETTLHNPVQPFTPPNTVTWIQDRRNKATLAGVPPPTWDDLERDYHETFGNGTTASQMQR